MFEHSVSEILGLQFQKLVKALTAMFFVLITSVLVFYM